MIYIGQGSARPSFGRIDMLRNRDRPIRLDFRYVVEERVLRISTHAILHNIVVPLFYDPFA